MSKRAAANQRLKLTGAAILVSRGMKVSQTAPAAYPYRSAVEAIVTSRSLFPRTVGLDAFPADEARAIRQIVDGFPDEDHRIVQIVQRGPDEMEVWTGQQLSPLCGGGRIIYVRRQGSRWEADQDSVGIWVS